MKILTTTASLCLLALTLAACGSDEKTTIVKEQPVIVQQPAPVVSGKSITDVENSCVNGYDNRTRSCY